ncbi:MAG: nitroreductase family protein [Clostridiaceae bacterium]
MDLMDLMKNRYSVRRFDNKPVPNELVEKLVEAARIAPTAHNYQPFKVYKLIGDGVDSLLSAITPCNYKAPLNLVITMDVEKSWKRPDGLNLSMLDAGIVCTHIMLMAEELGLGAYWIADINGKKAKELLGLGVNEEIITIFEIGYPLEGSKPGPWHTKRKTTEEIYSELKID